jgi:hypothetical protein
VKLQLKESEHRASLMQLRAELQAAWETEVRVYIMCIYYMKQLSEFQMLWVSFIGTIAF